MVLGNERSLLIQNRWKRGVVKRLGDTHFGRVLRFMYLKHELSALSIDPKTILDAGAGRGEIAMYLAARYPTAQVVGADVNPRDLEIAEAIRAAAQRSNLTFHEADLEKPLPYGPFDLIIVFEVLQYIQSDQSALYNIFGALRPGGICLIHVMDAQGAYQQIGARQMFHVNVTNWRDQGQVRAGYLARELEVKLINAGFARVEIKPTFGRAGMFAHSWFEIARGWHPFLYVLLFPVLVGLGALDVRLAKLRGGGLLAVATKGQAAG